ncbi:Fur family transcriptional regulator [Desulfuromonas versatilis]|nr:Fur family transcriptional regulator [Desulfuromonas versatilis]
MDQPRLENLLTSFTEACRQAGLKLTHQRLEIFRELAVAVDHPTAETLHQRLLQRISTLSLDTVYRTLATFCEYNLVQKVETVESQARFEVVHSRHHHLICKHCREIIDFDWPFFDTAGLPEAIRGWGKVDSRHVVVYGVCDKCLK